MATLVMLANLTLPRLRRDAPVKPGAPSPLRAKRGELVEVDEKTAAFLLKKKYARVATQEEIAGATPSDTKESPIPAKTQEAEKEPGTERQEAEKPVSPSEEELEPEPEPEPKTKGHRKH